MPQGAIDLDLLARYLKERMDEQNLTLREAAKEIGCGHATLARLLQGAAAPNTPDSLNLIRAASWVGKSLDDITKGMRSKKASVVDIEAHLRAMPDLEEPDVQAIVAFTKAVISAKKKQSR